MGLVAKVVIDLSLDREFEYDVPGELLDHLAVGSRVEVPFGSQTRRGYVVALTDTPSWGERKPVLRLLGDRPLISDDVLALARWMADYYCSSIEQAVRTVLPGAVRRRVRAHKPSLFVTATELGADNDKAADLCSRSPKQREALRIIISGHPDGLLLSDLARRAGTGSSVIRALEKKGLVSVTAETVARDPFANRTIVRTRPLDLMPEQAEALELINRSIDTRESPVVLLHGITGSGKTEVYLQAIAHSLETDRGAIVLVPEISLTPQTVERFRARFGETVAVLHSHLSDGERHDEWHRIHDGRARIVVGVRSAVFAPMENVGLIVVDEEHDTSYKQEEAPRYNARDVAVMRGHMEGCAVVLGSATPSLESYNNALTGKYALSNLTHRVDHRAMPAMRIIDMRQHGRGKNGKAHVLSDELVQAIRRRLDRGEQTILFLNRRGYSTALICPACGHVGRCEHCSVSLTYHRQTDELRCHICDLRKSVPPRCPECGDPAFRYAGVGTQRVEKIVAQLFPSARVQRMDSDATARKDAHWNILSDFRTGRIDILIGTQMIAKGLDFPNVTLIGVVHADLSLHVPDFRAGERTFQLLTQVAGRAGRGDVPGEVVVQTFTPFHAAIKAAQRLDYEGFCEREQELRRELSYPPFAHLVCVTARGPDEDTALEAMKGFASELKSALPSGVTVSGPAPAPIARARGKHRFHLMLRARSIRPVTRCIRSVSKAYGWPSKVACSVDVDAISLM